MIEASVDVLIPAASHRFQTKVVDAGSWDGKGFYSSGLIGGGPYLEWSVRITRPGKYRYACLIHPPMVGTLEVQA